MFGKKKDKQDVTIITPKGYVEHERLEVGTMLMARPESYEAWELDYNQQPIDEKTRRPVQFVSSMNKQPLKVIKKRPQIVGQATKIIAAQQFDEKLTQVHEAKNRQSMLIWLGIFAFSIIILIGIIILLNMG